MGARLNALRSSASVSWSSCCLCFSCWFVMTLPMVTDNRRRRPPRPLAGAGVSTIVDNEAWETKVSIVAWLSTVPAWLSRDDGLEWRPERGEECREPDLLVDSLLPGLLLEPDLEWLSVVPSRLSRDDGLECRPERGEACREPDLLVDSLLTGLLSRNSSSNTTSSCAIDERRARVRMRRGDCAQQSYMLRIHRLDLRAIGKAPT